MEITTAFLFVVIFSTAILEGDGIKCREARCVMRTGPDGAGPSIHGIVRLRQCTGRNTTVGINLLGFNTTDNITLHGFHVHQFPNTSNQCRGAGQHYNPFNKDHGGPDDWERHVGDLGNIEEDENGIVRTTFTDPLIMLSGNQSIIMKAIVVHSKEDDLGRGNDTGSRTTGNAGSRIGCCIIEEVTDPDDFIHAVCHMDAKTGIPGQNITGTIFLTQLKHDYHSMTTFDINLDGFDTSDNDISHGFHVHSFPNTSAQCRGAGGHYNPYNAIHGGPRSKIRHVGDLGNVLEDSSGRIERRLSDHLVSLQGNESVIDRAIVVHSSRDDLGEFRDTDNGSKTTGNAGSRIACCVIKSIQPVPDILASGGIIVHNDVRLSLSIIAYVCCMITRTFYGVLQLY